MALRRFASLVVLPLLLYAAGYAALTWPAITTFSTRYLCDAGDGMQNVWNMWWIREALGRGVNPYFTDRLFWPHGVTLLGQTLNPYNGLAGVPLQWFLSLVQAHNTLIVLAFAVTGWTCFLLARHVT